jgi:hypothetical protein
MPRPQLLAAQVVTQSRRRRLVRVHHRVVVGTRGAVQQVLAAHGWQRNPAGSERITLTLRQPVAAVGRRVITRCTHAAGVRQPLVGWQTSHNVC